jgi:hypothetical protein
VADSKAPYHLRPDVVEIHQVIGPYITVFSEVVATMRHGIGLFLGPADAELRPPDPLLETLFAQITADPIRAALFAISSQVGDLNDEDRSIRKALQTIVQHYIRLRNDIAHADWAIGWEVADTGELVPPAASKIKLAKDGIERTSLPFTAEQLRREIDHLHQLDMLLRIWINVCRKRQVGDLSTRPSDLLYVYKTSEDVGRAVGVRDKSPE